MFLTRTPGGGAAEITSSDIEFLELREELTELKSALHAERERVALYSQGYENVTRQYEEISRLASLLMKEAKQETEQGAAHESVAPVRTAEQRALVERALMLMEIRSQGLRAEAAYSASQQAASGKVAPNKATSSKATPREAVPQSASASLGGSKVPVPTEAIFIQTSPSGSEPKQ